MYRPEHNTKVVIFGGGGFARLAYVYFSNDSPYQVVAFTVHREYLRENTILGLDVIPFDQINQKYPPDEYKMFVAIGYENLNKARARVYFECKQLGYDLVSYISSRSSYWSEIEIGDNSFVYENNAIHPFVKIGNDVIIGSSNHIGHDSVIEDHCFLAGNVMIPGFVRIGAYSFIGGNSTLRDGITIGSECMIGAGAVILKNTKPGEVYVVENTQPSKVNSSILGQLMHSPFFRKEHH